MDIHVNQGDHQIRHATRRLMERMQSPLCGLDQLIGFMYRAADEPRFAVAGAELTGVHLLRNQPKPRPGFYHIGGTGVVLDEAWIRTLGETVERYTQVISEITLAKEIVFTTHAELRSRGEAVLSPEKIRFFTKEQHAKKGFPFHPFREDMPMGWLKVPSLIDDEVLWVPAQFVLVGYAFKPDRGERWVMSAVTTGSAAHTVPALALRSAILELIQLDGLMGHWYSNATCAEILLDERTRSIAEIVRRHFDRLSEPPRFFLIPNADLPGFTVACMLKGPPGSVPAVGIGVGIDTVLVEAMYKALIEGVGVVQLAKVNLFEQRLRGDTGADEGEIFDLDQNTAYYGRPENMRFLMTKFGGAPPVKASALPPDSTLSAEDEIRGLAEAFKRTGKRLMYLDLTSVDARQLGFVAFRVWSPDTLSLSLPSAPTAAHPRFAAYGGVQHVRPHPYP